jgi:hypothetical protein
MDLDSLGATKKKEKKDEASIKRDVLWSTLPSLLGTRDSNDYP